MLLSQASVSPELCYWHSQQRQIFFFLERRPTEIVWQKRYNAFHTENTHLPRSFLFVYRAVLPGSMWRLRWRTQRRHVRCLWYGPPTRRTHLDTVCLRQLSLTCSFTAKGGRTAAVFAVLSSSGTLVVANFTNQILCWVFGKTRKHRDSYFKIRALISEHDTSV